MKQEESRSDPPFRVTVSQGHEHVVVALMGELDLATAPLLREHFATLAQDGEKRIVLDLARLDFVDSSGLSVLVMGHNHVRTAGGSMVILNPSHAVNRVLQITGLNDVFTIVEGEAPAPASGK